ncbi:hypothetical protein ACH4XT_00385 [Streptomyces avidinii]|uniref:hypothetical protein n=1 Tax=Streptomyces avidinii TaxID=1895 RepID=UPI003788DB0C|nr:hypothetical protein OG592_04725 [Streptomyces avidinii]
MSPDRRPDLPAPVPESEDPVTPDLPPLDQAAPDLPGSGAADEAAPEGRRRAEDTQEQTCPDDDATVSPPEPPD